MDGKTRIATAAARGTAPKKRRVLWVAFLAFLVPLLVLLRLQYSWLSDLEETSAIARQARRLKAKGSGRKPSRLEASS